MTIPSIQTVNASCAGTVEPQVSFSQLLTWQKLLPQAGLVALFAAEVFARVSRSQFLEVGSASQMVQIHHYWCRVPLGPTNHTVSVMDVGAKLFYSEVSGPSAGCSLVATL